MHRIVLALGVLIAAAPAAADTPGESQTSAAFTPAGALVRLTTAWGDQPRATLRIGKAAPVELARGMTAGTVVAGHDRVVVALAVAADPDAASPADPFRIAVLADGALGEPVTVARPEARDDQPFAVAATATPDGFTVFFQDLERDDPSAARTYMLQLDATGKPVGAAVAVPVPWSLAAAAWNGDGYHLALLFTDTKGMRVSMVALTAAGQPIQHPDWASRPGFIADVHLVAVGASIRAIYRGGANGDRMLERDVTRIGSWGSEPPKSKDRGALAWSKTIAITAGGKPTKVAGGAARRGP